MSRTGKQLLPTATRDQPLFLQHVISNSSYQNKYTITATTMMLETYKLKNITIQVQQLNKINCFYTKEILYISKKDFFLTIADINEGTCFSIR